MSGINQLAEFGWKYEMETINEYNWIWKGVKQIEYKKDLQTLNFSNFLQNSLSIWLKKKILDQLIFYLHQCALKLAACDAIAELAQHTYLLHSENECHLLIVGVVSSADNQSS